MLFSFLWTKAKLEINIAAVLIVSSMRLLRAVDVLLFI